MSDDERIYRAVLLRADEAKYLETQTRPTRNWCPHLDVFHETGDGIDCYKWRRCSVCNMTQDDSDSWDLKIAEERKARKQREHREMILSLLAVGFILGFVTGMVVYWWCVP